MLSIFLSKERGWQQWFDDVMTMWKVYHNPSWNSELMSVASMIAVKAKNQIDWEPHIPIMFSRILCSIDLPVNYKNMKGLKTTSLQSQSIAREFLFLSILNVESH